VGGNLPQYPRQIGQEIGPVQDDRILLGHVIDNIAGTYLIGLGDLRFRQWQQTPKRICRGKGVAFVPNLHLSLQPRRRENGAGRSHPRKWKDKPVTARQGPRDAHARYTLWLRTSEINNAIMSSGCTPFAPRIPCLITIPSIAPVASRKRTANTGPVRKLMGRYDRRRGSDVRGRTWSLTSAS
jgi:hypothetical protein